MRGLAHELSMYKFTFIDRGRAEIARRRHIFILL